MTEVRKTFIVALVTLGGCTIPPWDTDARFPLCPAIAQASYAPNTKTSFINKYILDQASDRHVEIRPLSEYAAEFVGPYDQISWFDANYKFMLCAFDPKQVVLDRDTYISCMSHADGWVRIVRSSHPENLLLTQTKFRENCSVVQ